MLPALYTVLAAHKPVRGRQPFLNVTETDAVNSIVLPTGEIWIIDQIVCGYESDTSGGLLEILFDDEVIFSTPVPRGGPLPIYFPSGLSPENSDTEITIRLSTGVSHLFVQAF
jgi:hypothetical protein